MSHNHEQTVHRLHELQQETFLLEMLQVAAKVNPCQSHLNGYHLGNLDGKEEDVCLHRIHRVELVVSLTSMHSRVPGRKSLANPKVFAQVVLLGIQFVFTAA